MADLAGAHGAVMLRERRVAPGEIGRPLSSIATGLGLRIYRAGQPFGFSDPQAARLEADDLIVEVVDRAAAAQSAE
jgi:voltage-gated potassium channel